MTLSVEHKAFLVNNKTKIQTSFNLNAGIRKYLGVYINGISMPFMTFKETNTFIDPMIVGRYTVILVCVFDKTSDFDTQFDAFML